MTKLYLLGVLFLIPATLAFSAVELSPQGEGGDGCGEWVVPDQPNTTEVHVLEFTKAMEDAVMDAIANIHLQARSISLDTRAIEKSVRDTASKASWKEEKILTALADVIKTMTDTLNSKRNDALIKSEELFKAAVAVGVKTFVPLGRFQGEIMYQKNCCHTGVWNPQSIACNPGGKSGFGAEASIKIQGNGGAAFGILLTTEMSIEVKGGFEFKIAGFNPVWVPSIPPNPPSYSGASILVKATPVVQSKITFGGGAGALLTVTIIKTDIFSPPIPTISGTLTCEGL
jgi:hypothetical protein